jgi:hypothetical protein
MDSVENFISFVEEFLKQRRRDNEMKLHYLIVILHCKGDNFCLYAKSISGNLKYILMIVYLTTLVITYL